MRQGAAVFAVGNRLQAGWVYVGGNYTQHTTTGIPCGAPTGSREVVAFGADIANGNSGGPLFNAQGQVVGMVSCMSTNAPFELRGIAMPSETLLAWLNALDWARLGGA
jgi:S1-C subfamily serine protease